MKMKKYGLLLLLVAILTIATFVIPAMAESETVYYVKADGTGDYTDLFAAIDALPASGGKVVVASDLAYSATKTVGHTWTAKTGKITVTGENNPTITFSGDGAKHIIKCMSEIEWNNLTLAHSATASTEFYCGPSVIIGENVTFLAANTSTGVMEAIPAGYNNYNGAICFRGGGYNADCTDSRMEFYSGQFSYIQGGNSKYAVTNSVTIIVHSGVTVTDFVQLGGTNKNVKDVTCTIDGANVGYVYAGAYGTGEITGSVNLTVSNATVGTLYGQRDGSGEASFQQLGSTTGTLSGNLNVTLTDASIGTVNLSKLTAGSKNLTFQDCENTTVGDSLSDFNSVTLTNSTVTLSTAYAGPTPVVDGTSTLTDTTGVVAGNGSGEGGEGGDTNPDPDTPAGENVVFLSGEVTSSGDGTTPATAVKTLLEAYNKLGDQGGTIILCGNLTEDFEAGKYVDYPAKAVVITSKFGDYDYTSKVYTMNNTGSSRATLQFHAATLFTNIHLNETNSANKDKAIEFFTGPKLVFGEGVVTTYNGGEIDASGDGRFAVRVGFYSKNYVAADHNNQPATFWMQSGTVSFIQGGNHSKDVDNSYICLEGTAKVTVMLQAGGTRHDVGSSVVEIKSNASVPQFYINGYSDSSGAADMTSSNITISGGTVGEILTGRNSSTGKLANVDMTISGTASVGSIKLDSAYLTTGTQTLTLAEGLGDQTLSTGFGDGWDTIAVETGNDVTVNGKLTVGSAALSVGKNTTIYISEEANSSVPTYTGEGEIVLIEAPDHTHDGVNFDITKVMTGSGGQGNAIYGNYIFCCSNVGNCNVYDLTTGSQIASFKLGSYNGGTKPSGTAGEGTSGGNWTNHANQVMFGPAKFDESDPFPLLYVTTGNSGKHDGTGAYIAKCAIERILKKQDGTYYAETVQIIEFNDFDNIPDQGSSNPYKNMNQDGELVNMYNATTGRFDYISGNGYDASAGYQKVAWGWPAWFVDSDPTSDTAGKIYIKSARFRTTAAMETSNKTTYGISNYYDTIAATGGTVNAYIVTEFSMPDLPASASDPNYGKTVTLYTKDIENQFETEYEVGVTQGGTMYQGKIYYSYGWNGAATNLYTRNCLQIFDIAQEKIVAKLWLCNNSTLQPQEPECCSIWNGNLVLGLNGSGYEVFIFDYYMLDVDATEATCTQDGTIAHAVCSKCDGVYYSQTDYKTVLSSITGESAHGLQHVESKEPTADETGNIEYWYCEKCDKYYADANGTSAITQEETVLPVTGNRLGDANGDGHVDAYDAALIIKYCVGVITESELDISNLDMDGDTHVDAYDATLIQKFTVGAIDKFPVQ